MEWGEFELHMARKQTIKLVGDLLEARKRLFRAQEHTKLIGCHNETCKAIEENCDALVEGIIETVKLCAIAADDFKSRMKTPDAKPPPIHAEFTSVRLTPFQRMLAREGVNFDQLPKYVPTKIEARLPRILKFTLKTPKRKRRRSTKDNIPL